MTLLHPVCVCLYVWLRKQFVDIHEARGRRGFGRGVGGCSVRLNGFPNSKCDQKRTWDLLTVAAGRHSTSSDENCEKKSKDNGLIWLNFHIFGKLNRADYTDVYFDFFFWCMFRRRKQKHTPWSLKIDSEYTPWSLKIDSELKWYASMNDVTRLR